MTRQFSRVGAAVRLATASTYPGFYLRDNLASSGSVPALPPYNQCPDIIGTTTPIPDPQVVLSTLDSWDRIYRTEPQPGVNYYYVRGLNGLPSGAFDGKLSLFWTPAELLLFPSLWKNHPLATASGSETVSVSAPAGHIGVGVDPFVLNWPSPASRGGATFTSFVAQNLAAPIPTISSWIEMSQLMTQQLNFGWRNGIAFDPIANNGMMLHRMGLTVPGTVGDSATLQLIVTANGFVGDTIALLADRYTAEQKAIQLAPTRITQDGQSIGIQINLDPGFHANLTVQYWNTSDNVPAAGSTITVTASYVVPKANLEHAITAGVIDSHLSNTVARQIGVGPQPVAPVGAVTFLAGPSGP
ncbi:MAG TPA: hypothetical protein VF516_38625 [Kofleriaceae bacterium]